jgi:hypothetical protein
MRCFYQTIAHPRGGYLSTKLFIPRDVWRVKGVKLKNVEDKIANCDMLTAALQKLAAVDTNDADAVLEEMQSLELVLDQVQAQLAKKLGNEVGIQSVSILFKDATTVGEGAASADGFSKGPTTSQDFVPKGAVAQGKSYLASWRKLRSKNSGVNLANMTTGTTRSTEVPKDTLIMATLPMTSLTSIRFAKRDVSGMNFEGPNAGYMGSLARLFDAVQILGELFFIFAFSLAYALQWFTNCIISCRSNRASSRRPRPQALFTHSRWTRTVNSPCRRVLWLLHLSFCPFRRDTYARQVYQERE